MADKVEVRLTGFSFPETLHPDKANFRFVVEYRHFAKNDKPESDAKTLPSIDSYFECDWRKVDDRRYVGPSPPHGVPIKRFKSRKTRPPGYGAFDPDKLNPHDSAFLVTTAHLQAINLTVYDVDRKDFWDSVLETLADVAESLLGKLSDQLPDGIGLPDDLKSAIARKIAGPSDKIIGTRALTFDATSAAEHELSFDSRDRDYAGTYEAKILVRKYEA